MRRLSVDDDGSRHRANRATANRTARHNADRRQATAATGAEYNHEHAAAVARVNDYSVWQIAPTTAADVRYWTQDAELARHVWTDSVAPKEDPAPGEPPVDYSNAEEAASRLGHVLPNDQAARAIATADRMMSPRQRIAQCGACGEWARTGDDTFRRQPRAQLQLLRLSDERFEAFNALPGDDVKAMHNVYVYTPDVGEITDPAVAEGQPVALFLHPDSVNTVTGNVDLCTSCFEKIASSRLPTFCLAKGNDFGRLPPDLPPPTMLERLAFSGARVYFGTLKISPQRKLKPGTSARLQGHTIGMMQDAPAAVSAVMSTEPLPRTRVDPEALTVVFVGPVAEWRRYKSARTTDGQPMLLQAIRQFQVRRAVVFRWLRILKRCNPLYADVQIIDEFSAAAAELEGMGQALLDAAVVECSPAAIAQQVWL